MNYFLEPINIAEWNLFKEVCDYCYEESFYATKEMKSGDMIIFYIIKDDDKVPDGIYGNAIIIKNPYMVDSKRYMVDVKIKYIRFDEPIISFDLCKQYLKQFRSVHKIESDIMVRLMKTSLASIVI